MFRGLTIPTLWRIEQLNHRTYILILSTIRPTPIEAHERYGYPGCFPSWETWDYDGELEHIHPGMRRSFRLDAAVMADAEHSLADQVRLAAKMSARERQDWLLSQEQRLGCHFEELVNEQSSAVFLPHPQQDQELMAQTVVFTGLLTVNDADLFRAALVQGVGALKKYGFGLMTADSPGNWYHI